MPKVTLRLNNEQHAELVTAADQNTRSLQGEIIHRLFPPRPGYARVAAGETLEPRPARPDPKPGKGK